MSKKAAKVWRWVEVLLKWVNANCREGVMLRKASGSLLKIRGADRRSAGSYEGANQSVAQGQLLYYRKGRTKVCKEEDD